MSEYDDAILLLSQINSDEYDADTNPFGLDGVGGVDANLVAAFNAIAVIGQGVAAAAFSAFRATSVTPLTFGAGAKSLVTQLNKGFTAGDWITVLDIDNPSTRWEAGQVTTYDAETGDLDYSVAAGNFEGGGLGSANLRITLSAQPGVQGAPGEDGISVAPDEARLQHVQNLASQAAYRL